MPALYNMTEHRDATITQKVRCDTMYGMLGKELFIQYEAAVRDHIDTYHQYDIALSSNHFDEWGELRYKHLWALLDGEITLADLT